MKLKNLNNIPIQVGQEYPEGIWFYVKSTKCWFNSDTCSTNFDNSRYKRESDELTESEANRQGFVNPFKRGSCYILEENEE